MPDAPVETPSTETPATPPPAVPSNAGNATTIDLNHPSVKAALDERERKVQAAKDREIAQLHQQYQGQLGTVKSAAKQRLQEVGDEQADQWEAGLDTYQKAAAFDAVQQQAQAWAAWNQHVGQTVSDIAARYEVQIDPNEFVNRQFDSAEAMAAAVRSRAQSLAAAQREAERQAAQTAATRRVDAQIAAGAGDVLSGAPAAVGDNTDALMKEYRQKLKPLQGNVERIFQLQDEYRRKGLPI